MQEGEAKAVPGSEPPDGVHHWRGRIYLTTDEAAQWFFSKVGDPTSFDIEPEADTPHVVPG